MIVATEGVVAGPSFNRGHLDLYSPQSMHRPRGSGKSSEVSLVRDKASQPGIAQQGLKAQLQLLLE
ncbi:hypothetical protein HAX54_019283, partial [Datura stramonium]|nr:hypothetical protein [Datura stramonium]